MPLVKKHFTRLLDPQTSAIEIWRQIVLPTFFHPVPTRLGMRGQGPYRAGRAPLVPKPSPADNIDHQPNQDKEPCHD